MNDALALAEQTGLHYWDAELRRLRGSLVLQPECPTSPVGGGSTSAAKEDEAESCFLDAIAIARRQQAKSFELRAAMSLARLWRRQGKTEQARALLSDVYGWFTEGFATPDLVEAKGLLEELDGTAEPPAASGGPPEPPGGRARHQGRRGRRAG